LKLLKKAAFESCVLATRVLTRLRAPVIRVFHLDPALRRKCEAVVRLLKQHGLEAERVEGLSRASRILLAGTDDLWVGLWNSVPLELLPRNYIFWNGEPVHHERWEDEEWDVQVPAGQPLRWHESAAHRKAWKLAERGAQAVWEYICSGQAGATQDPSRHAYVPFGYDRWYEEVFASARAAAASEPEIDVLFFGWGTERRRVILDQLRARGVNVMVADEKRPAVGEELEKLAARSKIVLGIYGYDDPNTHVPDLARFDFVFANRIFVISEQTKGLFQDLDYNAHVTVCGHEGLVDACLHYLQHPALRAEAAERTYQWFRKSCCMEDFIPFERIQALRDQVRQVC